MSKNRSRKLGKPIKNVGGFTLRPIFASSVQHRALGKSSGKIGLCNGKNVMEEYPETRAGIEEASKIAKEIAEDPGHPMRKKMKKEKN